jgi:ribosome biogenesis ATPase
VFQRARASSPCIIFFDELDALCPKRDNDSGSKGTQRLVNQLLTEMDGFEGSADKQIFVIAATNRPDIIDPAMLRPGRLDKLVYVDIPSVTARAEILHAHTKKLNLASDVNLTALSEDARSTGFTGADLAALVRESGTCALRRMVAARTQLDGKSPPSLTHADFEAAFGKVFASVSPRDLNRYRGMQKKLRGSRAVIAEDDANADQNGSGDVGGGGSAASGKAAVSGGN